MYADGAPLRKSAQRRMSHFPQNLYDRVVAVGLPVRGQLTVVRPLTDDDVQMLVAWHLDPEVSRFWDDETPSAEEVRADLADPTVDLWLIEADGAPVGFVQSWREGGRPRAGRGRPGRFFAVRPRRARSHHWGRASPAAT